MDKYLKETKMLDYSNENIQQLIRERRWKNINEFERLKSIYDFVRDEILFGYNIDDNIPASKVLADGYGQCNTKGTLFILYIIWLLAFAVKRFPRKLKTILPIKVTVYKTQNLTSKSISFPLYRVSKMAPVTNIMTSDRKLEIKMVR